MASTVGTPAKRSVDCDTCLQLGALPQVLKGLSETRGVGAVQDADVQPRDPQMTATMQGLGDSNCLIEARAARTTAVGTPPTQLQGSCRNRVTRSKS